MKQLRITALAFALLGGLTQAQTPEAAPADMAQPLPCGGKIDTCYRVEMIVYRQSGSDPVNREWPRRITLGYPGDLRVLTPATKTGAPPAAGNALPALPATQHALADVARRLAGRYPAILMHEAWEQEIAGSGVAAVAISGGKTTGEHRELEGSVRLTEARGLRFQAHLWLTDFSSPSAAPLPAVQAVPATQDSASEDISGTVSWPELPPRPVVIDPQAELDALAAQESSQPPATSATESAMPAEPAPPARPERIIVVNSQERLSPGALHYLDHPVLGILVQVTPVTAPATSGSTAPTVSPATTTSPAATATP